jgi:acyl-coenzyme A synthetase/AMP-(fatty) acid ligase/acyl carrier protein
LIRMLEELDVTVLQATPATWQILLTGGWKGQSTLKALCGGEALTTDLATKLMGRVGTLWNLYGPTETTIWSCCRQTAMAPKDRGSVESIGGPIANTRIYILGSQHQAVPIGAAGYIYIGGAGVARGYLNQPERTAQRFLPDPFSADPGARIYETGDLGRWRADGTIEYLGRNDHQVKVRGFRIELGEIEAQLLRHARVKDVVVVAREDVPGDKRLVAYVVPQEPAEPVASAQRLRTDLKAVLPEHMVPSAFVMLERFPLTPNGKLDRLALPAPEPQAYVCARYETPQGEVEVILAEIWQAVLGVERVGRDDNFFELGGHSLTGLKLMVRIAETLAIPLRGVTVFQCPTVRNMAQRVETLRSDCRTPLESPPIELEEGLI